MVVLDGCIGYQEDERSISLCMTMPSRESEASGVNGDGERDVVAVVDADIAHRG